MESENEELQRRSSGGGIGDKYLTARRHTVGPGDTVHEQVCPVCVECSTSPVLNITVASNRPIIERAFCVSYCSTLMSSEV
jgi:hypothetical protein